MLCPYCVEEIKKTEKNCPKCEKEIPLLYKKYYPNSGIFTKKEPVVMSAVGFSGHGKTVYFASLLYVMNNELTKVWQRFFRQSIDREAVDIVRQNSRMLEQRELPESTRQNFPHPNVHHLAHLPKHKNKLLVIYDTSGEAFEEDLRLERYASFVTRTRTVMFLISLIDLENPISENIHRLLDVYVQGMERLKANSKKQNLIVVFTKADVLLDKYFKDYPDIAHHLTSPSYVELGDYKKYVSKLQAISSALADFMKNTLDAHNFVNMAKDSFKSVSYCAISSLGHAPEGARLKDNMSPIRVADPLLWILEKG